MTSFLIGLLVFTIPLFIIGVMVLFWEIEEKNGERIVRTVWFCLVLLGTSVGILHYLLSN